MSVTLPEASQALREARKRFILKSDLTAAFMPRVFNSGPTILYLATGLNGRCCLTGSQVNQLGGERNRKVWTPSISCASPYEIAPTRIASASNTERPSGNRACKVRRAQPPFLVFLKLQTKPPSSHAVVNSLQYSLQCLLAAASSMMSSDPGFRLAVSSRARRALLQNNIEIHLSGS